MAIYTITADNVTLNSTANTLRTIAAVVGSSTNLARIKHIVIALTNAAPIDHQIEVDIAKTNNAGAGTPASTPTPSKADADSRAAGMTAGVDYVSGEPTTYSDPLVRDGFNSRGRYEWRQDPSLPPVLEVRGAETLGVRLASGSGGTVAATVTIVWEE